MQFPVCCILGHVDVGKTKLLDRMRKSNVQGKEVGGITQQIGATHFSKESITQMIEGLNSNLEISGLLMIDTPGHDCFSQMRMIGVNVCHLAIVVVDLIKGIEKQTVQCLELLRDNETPFIIALNKLDCIHKWKPTKFKSLKKCLEKQSNEVSKLFREHSQKISVQLLKLGFNSALYYENPSIDDYISMVPVSALTSEGLADLIMLISKLTTRAFKKTPQLAYTHGYVVDFRNDEKIGNIYYAISMNGNFQRGQSVMVESTTGPIATTIKEIYTLDDSKEMKNNPRLHTVNEVSGTMGIAIKFADNNSHIANDGHEIALGGLIIANYSSQDVSKIFQSKKQNNLNPDNKIEYDRDGIVINVPAQTMANAIIQTLNSCYEKKNIETTLPKLKVSHINVGKINKSLIIRCSTIHSRISESQRGTSDIFNKQYNNRYAVILNYGTDHDRLLDKTIADFAQANEVTIISDDVIYKLFEKYQNYIDSLNQKLRLMSPRIINPFKLKILPQHVVLKTSPLLFGVKILEGTIAIDNWIEAQKDDKITILGQIISIQKNNKDITKPALAEEICIKVKNDDHPVEYGKDFDHTWELHNYSSSEDKHLLEKYPDVFLNF